MNNLPIEVQQLFEYLKAGTSAFHVIDHSKKVLTEAGFEELKLKETCDNPLLNIDNIIVISEKFKDIWRVIIHILWIISVIAIILILYLIFKFFFFYIFNKSF